ncbi:MAG TPA: response regulator transcription factor [Candidatus Dormibacteraeota bacterium]|jgi:DNA-binding NarL/FixJ family response regulator|nr:response regulator transcription factor [Candidatus Dormibacteraeota bacterium]
MKTIRVLLVDDHAIVRAGLKALLEAAADIQVIGEAENGYQAVHESERLRPDVVLLDLAMPRLNGVGAARQIAERVPDARVLILSSYSDAQHLREAIEAGVAGYLMKESAGEELLQAIRETAKGGASFSPAILICLLKECWGSSPDSRGLPTKTATLTERQTEVLQLIAEGYCNKQIADMLFIRTKTVEKHRQSLMVKLGIHKTAPLTRYAVSAGMVEVNRTPVWPGRPGPAYPRVAEKKLTGM